MHQLSIKDLDLKGKKVLLRVDFNVPFNKENKITDLTRIEESLPTIRLILEKGGTIILMSHLGRPEGKKNLKYTLKPCAEALSKIINRPVLFIPDSIGRETQKAISNLKEGEVALLENLRFYEAEEKPEIDLSFAKNIALYGDLYVNDAFGASHRNHSSIVTLASHFPTKAAAGLLLEKEIKELKRLSDAPSRPFHAIIGGSKISSKLGVLKILVNKVDALYIGGAMAFTFLLALGTEIGDSPYEPDLIETAKGLINTCQKRKITLFLPSDFLISKDFSNTSAFKTIKSSQGIEKGWRGMDIGPETLSSWENELKKAHSIFWNGPVGVFEFSRFSNGTYALAKFLSSLHSERVIGGGDSVAAINQLGLSKYFTHVSTGGGASLEFLEKGTLPGIEILTKQPIKEPEN